MKRLTWLLFLPCFLIAPFFFTIPWIAGAEYSDLLISHYPGMEYMRQALLTWRQVPLWSDTILSGYPFAANPLSGLCYPPGWLALLLPLPAGLNIVAVLHLVWGGLGMVNFLRSEGCDPLPALLGGVFFEWLPKFYAHFAAGHISLLFAIAWMPWLFWAEKRAFDSSDRKRLLDAGLFWGIILLADVRWGAYAGLFWFFYALSLRVRSLQTGQMPLLKAFFSIGLKWAGGMLLKVAVGILLALPLLLPLIEYVGLSTRQDMESSDQLFLSMPPVNLLGLVFPGVGDEVEWVAYPGVLLFLLFVWACGRLKEKKHLWIWVLFVLAGLLLAMGSYIPLMKEAAALPGWNLLRVPARALFMVDMALVVLSALAFQMMSDGDWGAGRGDASFLLAVGGVFIGVFTLGVCLVSGKILLLQIFSAVAALLLAAGLVLWRKGKASKLLIALVLLVGWVELLGASFSLMRFKPIAEVFSKQSELAAYLASQPGKFRVYSPSYSLPQHLAVDYGLELVDGVDPLQLASYAGFMELATGVSNPGYSVTLPPFVEDDPAAANRAARPDTHQLGLLNVKFIVSEFALEDARLELAGLFGRTYVYENLDNLARAWVQQNDKQIGEGIQSNAKIKYHSPNRIELEADGPGLLVLSEIDYPGWKAWVDGEPEQIQQVAGLLRGINLPKGHHGIVFVFQPASVWGGWAIGVIWGLVFIFYRGGLLSK